METNMKICSCSYTAVCISVVNFLDHCAGANEMNLYC